MKKQVRGRNNKIVSLKDNIEYEIWEVPPHFHITGNNNTIIIHCDGVVKPYRTFPHGLSLHIVGDNNTLEIHLPIQDFAANAVHMVEGNNRLVLGSSSYGFCGVNFGLQHGGHIEIGRDASIRGYDTRFYACGSLDEPKKIILGNGVRIAHSSVIRNMYGETILDTDTGKPTSEPKDIVIEDHVWIMTRCMVFAGCHLPEGSALAACSFANKAYTEKNTLLAGCPAKVIRRNIRWTVGTYHDNMAKWLSASERNEIEQNESVI